MHRQVKWKQRQYQYDHPPGLQENIRGDSGCHGSWAGCSLHYGNRGVPTAAINGGNLGARYYCIYTDGIFPYQECIIHRHDHDVLSDQESKENAAFCSIRQVKEHTYAEVSNQYKIFQAYMIHWRLLNRNRQGNDIPLRQFRVAHFFRNCYACENGSTTNSFFGTESPSLEWYLEPLL